MKISTRDETRHETVKGSDTWKASADSRHLERKPPRILLLSSIASFSVIERETDTRPTADRGRKPTLLVATASQWIPFAGQKGWRCGYESENNLIRKRAVPFPFALGPPIVPVNVARSVTSRRVKRPAGRGGGYWWRVETARETRIAYCAKHRTKGTTINNSCYSGGEARTPHISKITCAEEVARRERRGVYSEYSRDTAVSSVLMRTPFRSFHVSNWLERIRLGCMRVK